MNCKKLVLLVALFATVICAQRPGRGGQDRGSNASALKYLLSQHDANKDGKIDATEYKRGKEAFARLDKNSDGVINKDDFESMPGRRRRGDRSGRGAQMMGRFFSRYLDEDGDQTVTRGDWDKFLKACASTDDGIVTADSFESAGGNPRMLRFLGRMLDGDGDGDITRSELDKAFAMADANKDGQVAGKELNSGGGGRGGSGGQQGRGGRGGRGGRSRGNKLPSAGEKAPDFTLPTTDDPKKLVTLSDFAGDRPVALIFGSYT